MANSVENQTVAPNVVITGANRGIGLELARLYQARGCRVYAACRQTSPSLSAVGAVVVEGVEGVDVASEHGVAALVQTPRGVSIDVLINNAGILRNEGLGALDMTSVRQQFDVSTRWRRWC